MRRSTARRRRKLPVPTLRSFLAITLTLSVAQLARGDVLHLKNGGAVEGAVIEKTDTSYTLRTMVGTITVPLDAVDRLEEKPSVLGEYEQRRTQTAETAAAQAALARWCEEKGYAAGARKHFSHAIELDPDCEEARKALGFVRADGAWVKADSAASSGEQRTRDDDARRDEPVVAAIQSRWMVRIRGIKYNKLESSTERLVNEGRRRIAEITDPLAILPLIRVLGDGKLACRDALVAALRRFPQDEATANLAALALTDRDSQIRRNCLAELKRRNDPRVIAQFRRALFSDNDPLIRRAAIGLGGLNATSAVRDLIDSLTVQRNKRVEVSVRSYMYELENAFSTPTSVNYGVSGRIRHYPVIGLPAIAGNFIFVDSEMQRRNVTVFRTEVLEALRKITGQNFGFDAADWRRWYEEQRP